MEKTFLASLAALLIAMPAASQEHKGKQNIMSVSGQLTDVTDTLEVAFSSMKDFPQTTKKFAPIVVGKDKKFVAEYTLDEPGYLYFFESWPKQTAKKHQVMYTISVPALPGERLELGGTTTEATYGGSDFYKDYGDMYRELINSQKKVPDADYGRLMKEYELAASQLKSAKDRKQKTQYEAAIDSIRKQLESIYERQAKENQKTTLDYLKAHPNAEASALLLYNVPADSFDVAVSSLDSVVSHGRMVPYIEAARIHAKNSLRREKAVKNVKEGGVSPDWTLQSPDGRAISLRDFRGKYVLLDFWGSWCHWCVKGIPDMKEAYAKHKDKVEFVSIDCNDAEAKWKAALDKYQMPWKQVRNENTDGVPEKYAVQGYPTKILIDPEGKIVFIFAGEDPEFYKKLDEKLK